VIERYERNLNAWKHYGYGVILMVGDSDGDWSLPVETNIISPLLNLRKIKTYLKDIQQKELNNPIINRSFKDGNLD